MTTQVRKNVMDMFIDGARCGDYPVKRQPSF